MQDVQRPTKNTEDLRKTKTSSLPRDIKIRLQEVNAEKGRNKNGHICTIIHFDGTKEKE